MLHIGCSGWSYDEWKGVLYPKGYVDKLRYYSARFNTVEINSTYYSIPESEMVEGWISKVGKRKNFLFSLKIHRDLSHDLILRDSTKSSSYLNAFQSMVVYPLKEAGRLGCVLLQLPPYFRQRHMHILLEMFDRTDITGLSYFVEFRHPELYDDQEARSELESRGIGVVDLDGPEKRLDEIRSGTGTSYLRFHGHNVSEWRDPSAGKMERYDYLYSRDEIEKLAAIIKGKADSYSDVFIYFNNHPSGKAVRNAMEMSGILQNDVQTDQKPLF